jgi:hypothetical protein
MLRERGLAWPGDVLEPLLRILQSGEKLQVRFTQQDASMQPMAYLEHRR